MIIDFTDVNQDIVFFCAFRYCLGRRSYVVGVMVDEIIINWDYMTKARKDMFKKEIGEAIEKDCAGSKFDVMQWERVLKLDEVIK